MALAIIRIDDTILDTETSLAFMSFAATNRMVVITVTSRVNVIAVSTVVNVQGLNNCVANATRLTSGVASIPVGRGHNWIRVIIQAMKRGPSTWDVMTSRLPVRAYSLVAR